LSLNFAGVGEAMQRRREVMSGSSQAKPAEAAADLDHCPPVLIETANNFLISRHEEHGPVA
jgi:hypothetical protein